MKKMTHEFSRRENMCAKLFSKEFRFISLIFSSRKSFFEQKNLFVPILHAKERIQAIIFVENASLSSCKKNIRFSRTTMDDTSAKLTVQNHYVVSHIT